MKRYQLVVVGGGFAGAAAAISAGRAGVSTLLIERGNCLGGAAAMRLLIPLCLTGHRSMVSWFLCAAESLKKYITRWRR